MIACMGGRCGSREHCARYHATDWPQQPLERLCGDKEEPEPISARVVAQLWARSHMSLQAA